MTERERERQAAIYQGEFATQEEKIKALEKEIRQAERDYCYHKGYAEGKRDAMKWISTKDALPGLGMRVIVNIKGHGKVKPYQSVWTFEDGEREVWEQWVTHWMPLPPTPEGGQDD